MRRWGIVISLFYAAIVLVIVVPVAVVLSGASENAGFSEIVRAVHDAYAEGLTWFLIATMLISQVLLLFLSVDTTQKRLKPQARI